MSEYRMRPATIEARQFAGSNVDLHDFYLWVKRNTACAFNPETEEPSFGVSIDPETGYMLIATLEGVMTVKPGDWVIRGVSGEFYPWKPGIFALTYEELMGEE